MSKLLRASHFTSLLRRSFSQPPLQSLPNPYRHINLSIRAFVLSSETKKDEKENEFKSSTGSAKSGSARSSDEEYPRCEFEFKEFGAWKEFGVKLRMLVAFPWERIPYGTVLTMKLRGQISDQLESRVYAGLSLPQICENFTKAAYDPRISGIYLRIEPLNCGWGKVQEIRRHMLDFKKSGSWNSHTGKKREDIENFINEGAYQVERLKEDGWITNIKYDDEIMSKLKERLGIQNDKNLPTVDYRKYSMIRKWTVGLSGGKDLIAVIRASGRISRARGLNVPSSGIVGEQFIEKIRRIRESKRFKAVVIRIDSPGGDALASDLMWREIRLLAASKPVIASMADVAASGGYYMAMAAGVIVAEDLTLTGSIGVVTGKFNLGKLYEKIGFNKEILSRGRFAELTVAEHRPFRPDEVELFAKSAQNAYKQFRDKAAYSRSMTVDKIEEVAQGRVWTGKEAVSRGLVDAIGGFSRAVAIAKQKANIPLGREVTLVELSRPSPTLLEILVGIGNTVVGVDRTLQELLQDLASSDEIQAWMDGIMFQKLDGVLNSGHLFTLIKDYLSSL